MKIYSGDAIYIYNTSQKSWIGPSKYHFIKELNAVETSPTLTKEPKLASLFVIEFEGSKPLQYEQPFQVSQTADDVGTSTWLADVGNGVAKFASVQAKENIKWVVTKKAERGPLSYSSGYTIVNFATKRVLLGHADHITVQEPPYKKKQGGGAIWKLVPTRPVYTCESAGVCVETRGAANLYQHFECGPDGCVNKWGHAAYETQAECSETCTASIPLSPSAAAVSIQSTTSATTTTITRRPPRIFWIWLIVISVILAAIALTLHFAKP